LIAMRRTPAIAALLAIVAGCQISPPESALKDDFDSKPWEELQPSLPAPLKPENLVQIVVGPASVFRYFVDAASASVSEQGIVRFTLVARSSNGGTNVSYEGLRCSTYERRLYAFGRSDGSWSRARKSEWAPIDKTDGNRPYAALAGEFFCPVRGRVVTTEDAVRVLRQGGYGERPNQGLN
jgi:hypothetical protein